MRFILNLCAVALISLMLAEAAMRVFHHYEPLYIFYDDSYNRWRRAPGHLSYAADDIPVNAWGFKDEEFTSKQPETFRIAALGDSFAFAVVPHDYNYLTVLERRLRQSGPVEVLNLGIPGTAPADYLSLFVHEGLSLQPDMVLLSLFIGNDILETTVEPERPQWWEHSFVLSFIHYVYAVLPNLVDLDRAVYPVMDYCDECPSFSDEKFLDIEAQRSTILFSNNVETGPRVDKMVGYLMEIKEICDTHDMKFLVVLLPDEVQVNPELAKRALQKLIEWFTEKNQQIQTEFWDPAYPNRLVSARLTQGGIEHLDLYLPFSSHARADPAPLYKPRDTHWNILGNRLAGEVIADYITTNLPELIKR